MKRIVSIVAGLIVVFFALNLWAAVCKEPNCKTPQRNTRTAVENRDSRSNLRDNMANIQNSIRANMERIQKERSERNNESRKIRETARTEELKSNQNRETILDFLKRDEEIQKPVLVRIRELEENFEKAMKIAGGNASRILKSHLEHRRAGIILRACRSEEFRDIVEQLLGEGLFKEQVQRAEMIIKETELIAERDVKDAKEKYVKAYSFEGAREAERALSLVYGVQYYLPCLCPGVEVIEPACLYEPRLQAGIIRRDRKILLMEKRQKLARFEEEIRFEEGVAKRALQELVNPSEEAQKRKEEKFEYWCLRAANSNEPPLLLQIPKLSRASRTGLKPRLQHFLLGGSSMMLFENAWKRISEEEYLRLKAIQEKWIVEHSERSDYLEKQENTTRIQKFCEDWADQELKIRASREEVKEKSG